jgi:hypothetical protein
MELAAADAASLVGSVAALANDRFAKDGSGSKERGQIRASTHVEIGHICVALVQDALCVRFTNKLALCTSEEGRIGRSSQPSNVSQMSFVHAFVKQRAERR